MVKDEKPYEFPQARVCLTEADLYALGEACLCHWHGHGVKEAHGRIMNALGELKMLQYQKLKEQRDAQN